MWNDLHDVPLQQRRDPSSLGVMMNEADPKHKAMKTHDAREARDTDALISKNQRILVVTTSLQTISIISFFTMADRLFLHVPTNRRVRSELA